VPKIDLDCIERLNRTGYPPPFDQPVAGRWSQKVGSAFGLTDFGATVTTLEPGAWSSQRHWHEGEDELVVVLEGEAVLVEDDGETVLRAGDIAVFSEGRRQRTPFDQPFRRVLPLDRGRKRES
jgi:uncharacterized cupin superfamily protein